MNDSPAKVNERIVVVTGPTASGKTALAVKLAEALGGEIINADSVQVYRGFQIGAGAPAEDEFRKVPHHLFACREAHEEWNAGLFRDAAAKLIGEISSRGRTAFVVGGTGLYLRSLLSGLIEVDVNPKAKEQVEEAEQRLIAEGRERKEITGNFHQWLEKLDPLSAGKIRSTDYQRVRRALEVSLSQQTSIAELQQSHGHGDSSFDTLVLCLLPERRELYESISRRVDEMISAGFVEEVRGLVERHSPAAKPLQSIGYLQAGRYLRQEISEPEFIRLMKQETRRFAKRQETWWRHQPRRLGWKMHPGAAEPDFDQLCRAVDDFLTAREGKTPPQTVFYRLSGVGFHKDLR